MKVQSYPHFRIWVKAHALFIKTGLNSCINPNYIFKKPELFENKRDMHSHNSAPALVGIKKVTYILIPEILEMLARMLKEVIRPCYT